MGLHLMVWTAIQTLRRVGQQIVKHVMVEGVIYEAVFSTVLEITQISDDFYQTLKIYWAHL